ncbi:ParB/RepB/Spo0J family partition protein [Streptomyces solicathayae]|uniref:ParB/RepB/Spo0J family partition protein n=1 Tax=Streptomyces solicathayae TaxID=3081768 RepID=A0ABZ0M276_9ACTN|nr:ParB/RepB/Spo0J family partition protein [Streptomyces sp. HUAS YS2]WOX25827.1 ParB/RepB/Spo0J family partition protein [Streptomyces sp. HUAS YS2]
MSIDLLLPGESPRSQGLDEEHIARLAEIDTPIPPILVDRRTMRVIDGMHRLMAAKLRGQGLIEVELFDGTPEEAFLRAVEVNVSHGLPLSLADRRAAAGRIITSHPQMSDRAIARAAGLGAKAVAAIRRRAADVLPQLTARIGRDGKTRPLSSMDGRLRAAELIAERPEASLREVARLAGISPATVSDVRKRLESGLAPVVEPARAAESPADEPAVADTGERRVEHRKNPFPADPAAALEKLLRDPSLRHKEGGRQLLRLLQQQNAVVTRAGEELMEAVPSHCGTLVLDLARYYAGTWTDLAKQLDERVRLENRRGAGE